MSFSIRKSKALKNCEGERTQQSFVCYREGYKADLGMEIENHKHHKMLETRCGCQTKFRVHVHIYRGLWHITYFDDKHNHVLLEDVHCRMLPSHRTLIDFDILQLNNM